jgi:hypothetical protein
VEPAVIETSGEEVVQPAPAEPKRTRSPRKPKDEPPPPPASTSASPAGAVLSRMAALAEAQANLDVLTAEQEAATVKMHDAQRVVDDILAEIKEAI